MSTESQPDANKILFLNLIVMFGTTAMQQLGKLMNPLSGETEVDLEGARGTIDLIAMIKEKTAGNLDSEEDRILTETLSSLQMNYVQTAEAEKQQMPEDATKSPEQTEPAAAAEEKVEAEESPAESPAGESGDVEAASDKQEKEPKFHKSYG